MSKRLITQLFLGSLLGVLVGLVLLVIAGTVAIATGNVEMDGSDFVGFEPAVDWVLFAFAGPAVIILLCALVVQFVAWIGALMRSAQVENKTWFVILLVLGLLGLGFVPMLIYVLAGPDDGSGAVTENRQRDVPARI